jgi:hypothetical protein
MNFARFKCDERAVQSLMRNDAFALQLLNVADASAPVATGTLALT